MKIFTSLILSVLAISQLYGQTDKIDIKNKDLRAIEYTINGKKIRRVVNIFDFAITDSLNKNRIPYETISLSYEVKDKNGRVIYKQLVGLDRVFDQDRINFEYDSKGNLVKKVGVDENGKIKAGYSDIATYEYIYDKDKNLTETRYLGENGKLIQIEYTGPAIIRYKYDKNKNKTEEAYFDTNDAPLKDITKIVYTYDKSSKLIKEVAYNINGKVVD